MAQNEKVMNERTLPVRVVAERLKTSQVTILRLIELGELRAYQLTPRGWWRVLESSVSNYEARLARQCDQ